MINTLTSALSRRWRKRLYFARKRDWLVTMYDAAVRFAPGLPFPRKGKAAAVLLAEDPHPVYLRVGSSDGFVLEEIFLTKVYEPVTSRLPKDIKLIVDLGANCGFSARLWLKQYPQAQVIAVEPDADNFTALTRNVNADPQDAPRARLFQACVAAERGKVYLDRSAEECAFQMTDKPTGAPVDALPLLDILAEANAPQTIDLLKVDIEGAEESLFKDCGAWLDRVNCIMIELHPNYSQADLKRDLEKNGGRFDIQWTSETAGNPLLLLTRAS